MVETERLVYAEACESRAGQHTSTYRKRYTCGFLHSVKAEIADIADLFRLASFTDSIAVAEAFMVRDLDGYDRGAKCAIRNWRYPRLNSLKA